MEKDLWVNLAILKVVPRYSRDVKLNIVENIISNTQRCISSSRFQEFFWARIFIRILEIRLRTSSVLVYCSPVFPNKITVYLLWQCTAVTQYYSRVTNWNQSKNVRVMGRVAWSVSAHCWVSYRNQLFCLQCRSYNWFLYEMQHCTEIV